MFRAGGYFLKQGFKNIWNNKLMSTASIGIVAASLVLLGIFQLVLLNLNHWVAQAEQECEINVYLKNDISGTNLSRIQSELAALPDVAEVTFFSKEDRVKRTKETTYAGREYMLEDLEKDNIVRDSYILSVSSLNRASSVAEGAAEIAGVDEVVNRQDLVDKIQIAANMIRQVGFWLMLLLVVIAMFIIANTIRIGLVSRSGEVDIMRFVGASNSYISGPFMTEGVLLGVFGAVLGGIVTLVGYYVLVQSAGDIFPEISRDLFLAPDVIWQTIVITFVSIGAVIGLIGSGISIRKHLKV